MRPDSSGSDDETPFPETAFISTVQICDDLYNEPYSWDDDGVRSEIREQGSKYFRYTILDSGHAVCRAGKLEIGSVGEEPLDADTYRICKMGTNVSLVDIYESYGLPMMYAHLRELYNSSDGYRVHIYVAGSLALIKPKYARSLVVKKSDSEKPIYAATRALISQLVLELLYIDSLQPRMSEPLTTVQIALPDDILARIVGGRVSKGLREKWLAYKRSLPILIREGEMEAKASLPCVIRTKTRFVSVGGDRWRSITQSTTGMFILSFSNSVTAAQARYVGEYIVWSPRDYVQVYKGRGGDGIAAVRRMLWGQRHIQAICAWTVQLATELGEEWPLREVKEDELRALFESLRERFWSTFTTSD